MLTENAKASAKCDISAVGFDAGRHGAGPQLLHEQFEHQVDRHPRKPAVECNGQVLTYEALDRMSNQIARHLRSYGVGPGSLVGIYFEKSCSLFAALLGVLKAGGGYVPIDPKCPLERIRAIIDDAKIKIVISEGLLGRNLNLSDLRHVLLLDRTREIRRQSYRRLRAIDTGVRTTDVCYVIYTSGSTGGPKGVIVEHRNALGFMQSFRSIYRIGGDERVYQGFSVAFDASVEEIWAAFSLGGTLVVPPAGVASSPMDAAEFLTEQKITFFSTVPTFLTMIKAELPTIRLIIVGGEPCPPDLVTRWAPGRRMLNTYGPTEATVVATAGECVAGEPVTIGRPLIGYTAYVLDEQFLDVKPGEIGELFIGGAGVTRGYVNQPELTAERFVPDCFEDRRPEARLFRTHDLVRPMSDGSLQFVGRSDGLVKIRGFRIELSEVEAGLIEHASVRAAAVTVLKHGDLAELAAFVVLESDVKDLDRRDVLEFLRQRLPDYMVPRYLDVVDRLPQMTSGKVDRKMLPVPQTLLTSSARESILPATPLEREIVQIFEKCFAISPVFASDDFFRDLNGHSLLAARVVTELRAKFGSTRVSVRDLYEHRTACHLASHLEKGGLGKSAIGTAADVSSGGNPKRRIARAVPAIGRWACALAQAMVIFVFHGAITTPIVFLVVVSLDIMNGKVEWWRAAEQTSIAAFLVWPSWLLLSIAVKWIVIGRFKPGKYRVWGLYYLRWWIVNRFQSLSWSGMFVGTPLMSAYFRAMGAAVGPHCTINTPLCCAFDLIAIGRDTSIGSDTQILGYRVEDGWLILGTVQIGRGCFIGMHCNLGLDVKMGDGAWLDDMSLLPDQTVMGRGEARRGSPAELTNGKLSVLSGRSDARHRGFAFGIIHLALIYAMGYLLILAVLPSAALVIYALVGGSWAYCIASMLMAVPLAGAWWLVIVLCVKRIAIGQIHPGTYPLASGTYLRIWFLNYLLNNTRNLLIPIYATMLLPNLLRTLGAKVGRGVEISTVMHIMPDLLDIGDGSFLADGCIVGGLRIHRGWVEVMPNKIGSRTFVGNSALTPAAVDLGDSTLIGVLSTPPLDQAPPDATRWLGSPSFQLPNTEQAEGFAESTTYRPGTRLVLHRAAMEALKILLPTSILSIEILLFLLALSISCDTLSLTMTLLIAPCVSVLLAFGSVAAVAFVKLVLIGTFSPTVKPLWCTYIWFNEIINGTYESLAANAMSPLLGTPFIAPCLRMLGCKIGRWVFLETTLFSEFDLVKIGDFAALNLGATIQTHLFEDRVMKSDVLEIGDNCSVGNMAVILYGAKMQRGSSLGPLSLLMKGETLPEFSRWYGIPTRPDPTPRMSSDRDATEPRIGNGIRKMIAGGGKLIGALLTLAIGFTPGWGTQAMATQRSDIDLKGYGITATGLKPNYPPGFACSRLTSLYASWIDVDGSQRDEPHSGVDGGGLGDPILAPGAGTVHAIWHADWGWGPEGALLIVHDRAQLNMTDGPDYYFSEFDHLRYADLDHLKTGDKVARGERLANVFLPGGKKQYLPEVHWEVWEIGGDTDLTWRKNKVGTRYWTNDTARLIDPLYMLSRNSPPHDDGSVALTPFVAGQDYSSFSGFTYILPCKERG